MSVSLAQSSNFYIIFTKTEKTSSRSNTIHSQIINFTLDILNPIPWLPLIKRDHLSWGSTISNGGGCSLYARPSSAWYILSTVESSQNIWPHWTSSFRSTLIPHFVHSEQLFCRDNMVGGYWISNPLQSPKIEPTIPH